MCRATWVVGVASRFDFESREANYTEVSPVCVFQELFDHHSVASQVSTLQVRLEVGF